MAAKPEDPGPVASLALALLINGEVQHALSTAGEAREISDCSAD